MIDHQSLIHNLRSFQKNSASVSYSVLRERALAQLENSKLPSRQDEAWRYTPFKKWLQAEFDFSLNSPVPPTHSQSFWIDEFIQDFKNAIVLWNGTLFNVKVSLDDQTNLDIKTAGPNELDQASDFADLVTQASLNQSIQIVVRPNKEVIHPFLILYVGVEDGRSRSTAVEILCQKNSSLKVMEMFLTADTKVKTSLFHTGKIYLKQDSRVEHVLVQDTNTHSYVFSNLHCHLSRGSTLNHSGISVGSSLSRLSLEGHLNEPTAIAQLQGLYFAKLDQHLDVRTDIKHLVPECQSHQMYKGLLADASRGVFNGKISIARQAQKSDSQMLNRNLLLSSKAEVDTKPELMIDANDVKASHGATVGQLNTDELFYLQSRGIPREQAIRILAQGFAEDVVLKIATPQFRSFVSKVLGQHIAHLDSEVRE